MTEHEELVRLLATRSARRGNFTLASGRQSSLYIDARLTTMTPDGQRLIGRLGLSVLEDAGWEADAIGGLGGTIAAGGDQAAAREVKRQPAMPLIEADARSQAAFIERWTPRVAEVTNARTRKMLELILGEMKEHLRMLGQALEGRSDVLGRHTDGKVTRGEVMAVRPKN